MSNEEIKVVTKAEIPTKIFYYIKETLEVEEIVPEGILPDSLDNSHKDKYYYNDAKNKLYLVVKNNNETYEAKEIKVEGILPDPINNNHKNKYYYRYNGIKEFPIGVSDFSRIWGTVNDGKGNPITNSEGEPIIINLQDAMNALYQMMTSRSHVWTGSDAKDVPDYAKLFIQTDTNNS